MNRILRGLFSFILAFHYEPHKWLWVKVAACLLFIWQQQQHHFKKGFKSPLKKNFHWFELQIISSISTYMNAVNYLTDS